MKFRLTLHYGRSKTSLVGKYNFVKNASSVELNKLAVVCTEFWKLECRLTEKTLSL